jgi:hypothetical protein
VTLASICQCVNYVAIAFLIIAYARA